MRNILRLAIVLSSLAALACSSDGENGGNGGGGGSSTGGGGSGGSQGLDCSALDYAALAATDTTPVSYSTDVFPIFQTSCSASTCHCSPDHSTNCGRMPMANLYLAVGVNDDVTPEALADAHADSVGMASTTAPAVMRVVAGDPGASFLIQKLSNTHNDQGHTCQVQDPNALAPCGAEMPNLGGGSLCETDPGRFTTIVRWVAQNAPNN